MKRFGLWVPIALSLAAFAFLYRDVIAKLVYDWTYDGNFSHGFLIVPIAAYLVWERRKKLAATPVEPALVGLLLLLGSLATLAAGVLGAELFLSRISIIGVLGGVVLFTGGWRLLRVLMFPLAFLLLMIPIPAIVFNQISFPLQLLASRGAEYTLSMAHIPVLREGNVIVLANTSLEVAEACSGIRSTLAIVIITLIAAHFVLRSNWRKVVLLALVIPISLFKNAVRIVVLTLLAIHWDMDFLEGRLHRDGGFLFMLLGLALMYPILLALARSEKKTYVDSGVRS